MARANLSIRIEAAAKEAIAQLKALEKAIKDIPNRKQTELDADASAAVRGAAEAAAAVDAVPDKKTTKLDADIKDGVRNAEQLDRTLINLTMDTRTIDIRAQITQAQSRIAQLQSRIARMKQQAEEDGIDMTVDIGAAEAQIRRLEVRILRLKNEKATVQADLDIQRALRNAATLEGRLETLEHTREVEIDANIVKALADIQRLEGKLAELRTRPVTVRTEADIATTMARLRQLELYIAKLNAEKISIEAEVDVDTVAADAKFAQLRAEAAEIERPKSFRVDADIATAEAQLRRLATELTRLESQPHNVNVDADIAAAEAKIKQVQAQLALLRDKKIKVDIDHESTGRSISFLTGLLGGLSSNITTIIGTIGNITRLGDAFSGVSSSVSGASSAMGGLDGASQLAGASLGKAGAAGALLGLALQNVQQIASTVFSLAISGAQLFMTAMVAATVVAGALTLAVAALGAVAAIAFAGFGAAMLAVGAIITLIVARAISGSKDIQESFKKMNKALNDDIVEIAKPFVKVIQNFIDELLKARQEITGPLRAAFTTIAGVAQRSIGSIIETLKILSKGFETLTTTLGPAFEQFFKNLPSMAQAFIRMLQLMSDAFMQVGDAARQAGLDAFEGFMVKLGELGAELIRIGATVFPAFMNNLGQLADGVKNMASQIAPALAPAMQAFTDLGLAIMQAVAENRDGFIDFSTAISTHSGSIKSALQGIIDICLVMGQQVIEAFGPIAPQIQTLADKVTAAKDQFGSVFESIVTIALSFAQGFVAAIKSAEPGLADLAAALQRHQGTIDTVFSVLGATISGFASTLSWALDMISMDIDGIMAKIETMASIAKHIPGFKELGSTIETLAGSFRNTSNAAGPAADSVSRLPPELQKIPPPATNGGQAMNSFLNTVNRTPTVVPPASSAAQELAKEITPVGGNAATAAPPVAGLMGAFQKFQAPTAALITPLNNLATAIKEMPGGFQGLAMQVGAAGLKFQELLDKVTPLTPLMTTLKTNVAALGTTFGTNLVTAIQNTNLQLDATKLKLEALGVSVTTFSTTLTTLGTTLTTVNPALIAFDTNINNITLKLVPLGAALTTFNTTLTTMGTLFTGTLNPALLAFNTELTNVQLKLVLINAALVTLNTNLTNINTSLIAINTSLATLNTSLTTFTTGLTNVITKMTEFNEALTTSAEQINTFVETVTTATQTITDSWTAMFDSMLQATVDGLQAILDTFDSTMNALADYLEAWYPTFEAIGQNFGISIANGMLQAQQAVFAAGQALGAAAMAGFMSFVAQGSPSREAIAMGLTFGESLAMGMDQAQQAVNQAGRALGASALGSIMGALTPGVGGGASMSLTGINNSDYVSEPGDTYVTVEIDGKEFRGMIKTEIARDQKNLRRALAVN